MSVKKTAAALAAIPLTLGLLAQGALADPPHGKGKGPGKPGRESNVTIIVPGVVAPAPVILQPAPVYVQRAPVVYRAGPPPWAPAHGYRRKGQPAYVAPFGINVGNCYREQVGQVLGGVAGAAIGSQIGQGTGQIVAAAGGALLGVLVGGSIGRSMDRLDYACAGQVLEYATDNRTIVWNNPQSGGRYQLTPLRAYQDGGRYCREYTSTASVGGQRQQVYGTACRQPDGSWQIVS
ncbi:MAG: RT0821/Lpp0805 family surface protein [Alphaproteobacteria bacterium]